MRSLPPATTKKTLRAVLLGLLAAVLIGVGLTPAAGSAASSVTIWGDRLPGDVRYEPDARSVELGTRFTATVGGSVEGLRFYKANPRAGTFTGTLWSSSGESLATATFDAAGGIGWRTATLDEPVTLTAGETYVASYRAPAGTGFAVARYFSGRSASSELTVPSRNSGVYTYASPGTFPQTTWRSSQYWVDVVYAPDGTVPRPEPTDPTPTPEPTPTPTETPTPTPTPTPEPTPDPTDPPEGENPDATGFPTRATTGVPAGWQPKQEITGDYTVWDAGQVLEDVRITGGVLYVRAPNVTLRRVELSSARIVNEYGGTCFSGLNIEDSTIVRGAADVYQPVIQSGGYTATRVEIDGVSEGFRIGGGDVGCGPVLIQDSWAKIDPAQGCDRAGIDWHGDGLQGYWGVAVTLRNSSIAIGRTDYCQGTAAFFYPNQNNTSATVENVLLSGGGYVFRLETPGSVSGLKIVDDSWEYGPTDVTSCGQVAWGAGNEIVRVNPDGSLTSVAPLRCEGW